MSSSDKKNVGEIISAECKDGPVMNRSCTDILCLIIFLATFIGLWGVAIYGFSEGTPELLYTPMDPDGTFCGYSDNATDYPYIYFVAPTATTLFRTTCVKTCPTTGTTVLDCLTNSMVHNCSGIILTQTTDNSTTNSTDNSTNSTDSNTTTTDSSTTTTENSTSSTDNTTTTTTSQAKAKSTTKSHSREYISQHVRDIMVQQNGHKQAVTLKHLTTSYNYSEVTMIYPSVAFSTVCLPLLESYLEAVETTLDIDGLVEALEDLELTWPIALACCGFAVVLGFIFMLLTRLCAKAIVWIFILLLFLSLLGLGIIFLMQAEGVTTSSTGNWASDAIAEVQSTTSSTTMSYVVGITCCILAGIVFILVSCFFSRIRLATAIIESAALFVAENPTCLLVPIFNFFTVIIWLIFSLLGFLWLISTGDVTNEFEHFPYGNFELTSTGEGLACFFFVGFIWVFAFILHMAHFIFGLATAFWYFERMQEQKSNHPVLNASKWFFRYHVGSVAFGSGIIAMIWLLQMFLSMIARQYKAAGNKCGKFIISCLQCYTACFERFVAYLSKNAYTYIGMTGKNFLPAAWNVFQMILRNPLRFSITGFLGDVFQLFGEAFICIITAIAGYQIITNDSTYSDSLNSAVWPTVVFAFVGFIVGSLFMTVYGAVADAILIVFVLDEEIHKNHLGKMAPEKIPAPLQSFVQQAEEHNSAFQAS